MDFPVGVRAADRHLDHAARRSFTLRPGDEVEVDVPAIGTLSNPVREVGRPAPVESEAAS